MDLREIHEYRALRRTIAQRGTARVWVMLAGLFAWAALSLTTLVIGTLPIVTVLPLLLLAASFEAVFSLYVGVERIGRYLQVFHEREDAATRWEHVAMAYGRTSPRAGTDPLFSVCFLLAGAWNLIASALSEPILVEWAVIGLAHAVFLTRIVRARRFAAAQRALDLDRFQTLRAGMKGSTLPNPDQATLPPR